MSEIEKKLLDMGYTLPKPPSPAGNYLPGCRSGSLVFLSGVGPRRDDGSLVIGKIGDNLTIEEGYNAACLCGLGLLANLKEVIGDLDRVDHIVKVFGMVNCSPDFGQQPLVINGCSDLLVKIFGDAGCHARSAVGMTSLPNGIAVEVEIIMEVRE
ncbi:RidA family protein [Dehalococcoidia bacterium]|nr:RidA family protein [Dehalococcoidia bacterium]